MSSPVWRMVSIQASSGTAWVPSPLSASEAAGLETWLRQNKYSIPPGAAPYLTTWRWLH